MWRSAIVCVPFIANDRLSWIFRLAEMARRSRVSRVVTTTENMADLGFEFDGHLHVTALGTCMYIYLYVPVFV